MSEVDMSPGPVTLAGGPAEPATSGDEAAPPDRAALRLLVDTLPHLAWIASPDGTLTYLNRRAAEYTGGDVRARYAGTVFDLLHPDDAEEVRTGCAPAVRTGQPVERDCRIRRADGEYRWHRGAAVPRLGDTGSVIEWLGTLTDVHDQKEAERQLAELQHRQLQDSHDQKLESLGRLSAGLAHEINTPIQFVGDNTRFLAEAYQQMLELLLVYRDCMGPASGHLSWEERQRRAEGAEAAADIEYLAAEVPSAVEQSLEGTERVASIVRAMKAFSYKDSRERGYADLNEAIRTTVTVARNEVKYVADVVLDLGDIPDVLCHRGDLNQVFLNLLVNAADAMQDKGERGEIRVTTRADGPAVVISFADNGSGIPDKIRQSIFEPFFTTKEVGKGTGQGLALARAVCEKHGGTIEVDSVPGEGTEFVLRLPVTGQRTPARTG